mmetsp:Transcript_70202/g.142083  ORF Transcript_70202/g.142083 Transcript_70202/m.142083 type:complete len:389 (+) Transcript_70202:827-1993(+)
MTVSQFLGDHGHGGAQLLQTRLGTSAAEVGDRPHGVARARELVRLLKDAQNRFQGAFAEAHVAVPRAVPGHVAQGPHTLLQNIRVVTLLQDAGHDGHHVQVHHGLRLLLATRDDVANGPQSLKLQLGALHQLGQFQQSRGHATVQDLANGRISLNAEEFSVVGRRIQLIFWRRRAEHSLQGIKLIRHRLIRIQFRNLLGDHEDLQSIGFAANQLRTGLVVQQRPFLGHEFHFIHTEGQLFSHLLPQFCHSLDGVLLAPGDHDGAGSGAHHQRGGIGVVQLVGPLLLQGSGSLHHHLRGRLRSRLRRSIGRQHPLKHVLQRGRRIGAEEARLDRLHGLRQLGALRQRRALFPFEFIFGFQLQLVEGRDQTSIAGQIHGGRLRNGWCLRP